MSWIAVAAAGGALVSGVSSNMAARTQTGAGNRAIDLQRDIYNQSRSDLGPYREAGLAALTRLQRLMGISAGGGSEQGGTGADFGSLSRNFSSSDLNNDPVYQSGLQFGLGEGEKAINNRAIAAGGYDSGATLKALTRFGNDYGSTKAAESYNRFITNQGNQYSRLSGLVGSGQNAANMTGNLGAQYAGAAGNTMMGIGNAQAAGQIGLGNAANTGLNNYGQYQLLQQLSGGGQRSDPNTSYIEQPR